MKPEPVKSAPAGFITLESLGGLVGDFTGDQILNSDDIDLLGIAIGNQSNDTRFDLDHDGSLGLADLDTFLTIVGTVAGDTNLDGAVAFDDFLVLSKYFGQSNR